MHYTHNAFLFAAIWFTVSAGCMDATERSVARKQTKDDGASDAAVEAGGSSERIKPPETTTDTSWPESNAEPDALDAEVAEEQPEVPLRPTSLFADAETPQNDDAGDRASRPTATDAANPSLSTDDSLGTDSAIQEVADSAPPRIPAPTQPGEIVITEVMPNPKTVTDSQGEWFEIYNPSSTATYNLRDCEIADDAATKCTVTTDLVLEPLGWATLARNASPGFPPTYICSNLSLTNSDPDQVIVRCGPTVIDRMAYQKAKEAASFALDGSKLDAHANDDPASWCASTAVYNGEDLGTPGATNTSCAPDAGQN